MERLPPPTFFYFSKNFIFSKDVLLPCVLKLSLASMYNTIQMNNDDGKVIMPSA